jgi:hypothetical protein
VVGNLVIESGGGDIGFRPFDVHVIQNDLFLRHKRIEVETDGTDIVGEFFGPFLEEHVNAGLVEFSRSPD